MVNKDHLENRSQYDVMDTLFHELRHNFQRRAVSGNLSNIESADEKKVKEWKLNELSSPIGYSNYISTSGEHGDLYYFQPVEEDAFKTGLRLTRKAYTLISSKLGEDVEFKIYGNLNKDAIMLFFSEEQQFVDLFKRSRKAVFDLFRENNKKFEIEKKCLKVAKNIMKKDVSEMNREEICALFSVYVWARLDDDYKIDLIKAYDKLVNPYKPIKIQEESNTGFKIDGQIVTRDHILGILNILFSYELKTKVDAIIKGKEECDPKLKEDLTANMFKFDNKKINYIRDVDNFLLYSIQPYALFEGRVIINQFKEIKECEKKFYGVDEGDYDSMIDFYDNDKYIPYIEKFYKKSFKTIYNDLVKKMKENVKIAKKKKI